MRQLALPLLHRPPADLPAFLAAPSNEAARRFLAQDPAQWPSRRLWLWGAPATGKSHLLHLWSGRLRAAVVEASAVPSLAAAGALPSAAGLAIDDADHVADEPALLHLLNIAAEQRVPTVLASRDSPARLPVRLADLASRLRATLAVAIEAPDDELLDALLVRLLTQRHLAAPPALIRYLRLRLPRAPERLRDAVARLDAAALSGHRPVNRTLAARLFDDEPGLLDGPDPPG